MCLEANMFSQTIPFFHICCIFLSFNPFRVIRIFTIDILLSLEGTMKLPLPCQMGKIYVKVVIGCFVFAKYFELLCTFDL